MRLLRPLALATALAAGTALAGVPTYALEPDTTPPTFTLHGSGPATFYPVQDSYKDLFTVDYDVSDDQAALIDVEVVITNGSGTEVYSQTDQLANPSTTSFGWNGRNQGGSLVPAGAYALSFTATDDSTNVAEPVAVQATVSLKKLVQKKLVKTVKAQGSTVDQIVGRCSRLRKPSLRGWAGSLGYYSNTRCTAGFDASVALTVNVTKVPGAFENRYRSLTIKAYGGAARSRPGSQLLLQYYRDASDEWVRQKFLGSRVGTHSGARVDNAKPFVHHDSDGHWLAWSAMVAKGHRYDVRDFTVVLAYTALV